MFWQLVKQDKNAIKEDGGKEAKNPNSLLEWMPEFKYADTSFAKQPNVVRFSPLGTYMASAG